MMSAHAAYRRDTHPRDPHSPQLNSHFPKSLRLFWWLNVLLSGSCVLIMRGDHYFFHAEYPHNLPFMPLQHWVDFFCFQKRFQHFHQLDVFSTAPSFSFTFMYPAPAAVLYQGFYLFGTHAFAVFLLVTMLLLALLAALLGRSMVRAGADTRTTLLFLLSAAAFSYPFWFEYMLGNMEVCIFLIVSAGLLAYLRGYFYLAAALIGLAASIKIFPFVYLALLLSRKKYLQLFFGVAVAAATTLASLWLLCPSLPVAYRGVQSGLTAFRDMYMLQFHSIETGFDHSIFGFLKSILHLLGRPVLPVELLTGYLAVAALAGVALYFLRIRHLPELNQIVCLCVVSILLPPTSHDYTLIHLYFPWGLMILYALRSAHTPTRGLILAFVTFAILMSAESELIYKVGYSGQLKAIALVVLLVAALKYPWQSENISPTLTQPGGILQAVR